MKYLIVFIAFSLVFMPVQSQSFSDFTKEEVESDIIYLVSSLQKIHPKLNQDNCISAEEFIKNLNSESYSESDAFFILNGLLKQLNDGHSNVKFSQKRSKHIINYGTFFPYELEFFDSTAVITGHINKLKSSSEQREIFKINNIPVKDILDDLAIVAMVDGEHNKAAIEWLSDDFWFYFTLYNGFRNSYSVTFLEDGKEVHEIAKAQPRYKYEKTSILDDLRSEPMELDYLMNVPIVSVSGFDKKSNWWWRKKIDNIFDELDKSQNTDLILDLRGNGGGQENLQNILLKAFGVQSEDKYEQELLKEIDFSEVKGLKRRNYEYFKSLGLRKFTFPQKSEGDFRKKRKRQVKNAGDARFDGELFILMDGTTFSCGSDAAAILKENYPNTTLIGTETRGSGRVNYAGYFVHLNLPKTGFEVRIPRVKYVLKTTEFSENSGVIPDVRVQMKKSDVQSGVDTQLTHVLNLIMAEKDDEVRVD